MSALTPLPAIAPAVPSVPQGSSDAAASGFRSLLAALSGETASAPATKSGPATIPEPEELTVEVEVEVEVEASPVPAAPPAAPAAVVPFIPEAPAPPATRAVSDLSAGADDEPVADTTPPAAPLTRFAGDLIGPNPATPPPVERSPTPATTTPQVPPLVADVRPLGDPAAATRTNPAAPAAPDAAPDAAAAAALIVEAPAPRVAPTSSFSQGAAPVPLRPLADRQSRSVEATAATTSDGTRASDVTRPSATPVSAAPPARDGDRPARPTDFIVDAAPDAGRGEGEDPTSEPLPPAEAAAAPVQAPADARDSVASTLSRAAVEATAQIAAQILRRLEGRSTRFEMALTPDELGRVDVKLDIDSEGRLNARLAFDNPLAATDLRDRADELRRQLEDAGFHLADDALEFTGRDSGSSAFDGGRDARKGPSRAFAAASRLNAEIDVAQPPPWLALSLSPPGVDMKV